MRSLIEQFSTKANQAFIDGKKMHHINKLNKYLSDRYHLFIEDVPVGRYTFKYFALTIIEAGTAGYMLRPIMSEFDLTDWVAILVGAVIYGVLISALTAWTGHLLFGGEEEVLELRKDIKNRTAGTSKLAVYDDLRQRAKSLRRYGFIACILTTAIILSLGMARIYVMNEHTITVPNPLDAVVILFSLGIGWLMIYYGKYIWQYISARRAKKVFAKSEAQEMKYRVRFFTEGHKALDCHETARDTTGISTIESKNILTCFQRMRTKTIDDPLFFVEEVDHKLPIHVSQDGDAVANKIVVGYTPDKKIVSAKTDRDGNAELTWKSEHDFLIGIQVNASRIMGNHFQAGAKFFIDLDKNISHMQTLPPSVDKTIMPSIVELRSRTNHAPISSNGTDALINNVT